MKTNFSFLLVQQMIFLAADSQTQTITSEGGERARSLDDSLIPLLLEIPIKSSFSLPALWACW